MAPFVQRSSQAVNGCGSPGACERRQSRKDRSGIGKQPGLARELLQQPGEGEGGLDMAFAQQPGVRVHLVPVPAGGVGQLADPDQMAGPQGEVARMHPGADRGEPAGGLAEGEPGDQAGADRLRGGVGLGVHAGERVLRGAERSEQTRRIGSGQPVGRDRTCRCTAGTGRGLRLLVRPDWAEPGIVLDVRRHGRFRVTHWNLPIRVLGLNRIWQARFVAL